MLAIADSGSRGVSSATSHERSSGAAIAAVAVPLYRESFDADEKISVRHLTHFLSAQPIIAFAPHGLAVPSWVDDVRRFDPRFFRSVDSYSRLLLSSDFYRAFDAFQYILIYQLDSLVFSGDLPRWCARGWDYVGAPWPPPVEGAEPGSCDVGNGGFSLRRVEAHLEVLESGAPSYRSLASQLLAGRVPTARGGLRFLERFRRLLRVVREVRQGSQSYAAKYTLNEDRFWAERAHLFRPDFSIPSAAEAMKFSFEKQPSRAYDLNDRRLPFGCHGWSRYERGFWARHLLAE